MPSEAVFPMELAGPFTPQKSTSNSPAPSSQQPNHARSKPRTANGNGNGNRARAKHASSPGPAKHGRTTPPHVTASKPIAAAAFAGATFHASPAPSSLPIPSFLSKALDSPSVQETDHVSREPSPPATDSEAPTPQHRLLSADITRQESPLDIFFRADRAEKERARRASSANILGPNPIPLSPPTQIRSPAEPKTLPSGLFGASNRRPPMSQRNSSAGIPASELDGTPGTVIGPALAKPYQERIRAARSTKKQSEPAQKPALSQQDSAAMDMSERLKRFLSIPPTQDGQQPSPGPTGSQGSTGALPSPFAGAGRPPRSADLAPPFSARPYPGGPSDAPSPFGGMSGAAHPLLAPQGSATTLPPAMGSPGNGRSAEILHMEDSLRRMLKLNLGPAPAAPQTNHQSS